MLFNYLSWIYELKPLIEKNLIRFISQFSYQNIKADFIRPFSGGHILDRKDHELIIKNNDLYKALGFDTELLRVFLPKLLERADKSIADTYKSTYNSKGSYDLFFPSPYYVHVLKKIIEKEKNMKYNSSGLDLYVLPQLLTTEVPNLSALSFQDISSIRLNDQVFEDWRINLKKSLDYISNNQNKIIVKDIDSTNYIKDSFKQHSQALSRDLSKSKNLMSAIKSGAIAMTVGGVAEAVKAASTGASITPSDMIVHATTGVLVGLSELKNIEPTAPKKSAINHYLLFK